MLKKYYLIIIFGLSPFFANAQCFTAVKTTQNEYNGCTIVLQTDGTLWAWGFNTNGNLANGQGTSSFSTQFPYTQIGTSNDWSSKFFITDHVAALKNDGTLFTWGNNNYGQCGNGTNNNTNPPQNYQLTPQQIGTDTWIDIACGLNYTLGIKSNGTLWAWGVNSSGELGTGNFTSSAVPIQIGSQNNWEKVFANSKSSFAIKNDGTLWSWGFQTSTLGRATGDFNIPGQVGNDTNWSKIAPELYYVEAIKSNGTLWAWGSNPSPPQLQLYYGNGNPDTNNYVNNPTQIGTDNDWEDIVVSFYDAIALKTNNTLWGFGRNQYGELGDGTATVRYLPVQLGTDNDWSIIGCYNGWFGAFAIKQNNTLYKWGQVGQYGPVQISVPTLYGNACNLSNTSISENKIAVYPNPVYDIITVTIDSSLSEKEFELFNSLGQRVTNFEVGYLNKNNFSLNLCNFSSGLYFLTFKSGSSKYSVKIIKK